MHKAELTVRAGSLFACSVICRSGNISQLEPHELYTARAVSGLARTPQGFAEGITRAQCSPQCQSVVSLHLGRCVAHQECSIWHVS